jgi:hypothetical protein
MRKVLVWASLTATASALCACADYPPPPPYPPPGLHVRWCLAHHPGYDPRSNLFPGRDGRLHPCRVPPPRPYGPPPGYGPPPPPYGPPPPR